MLLLGPRYSYFKITVTLEFPTFRSFLFNFSLSLLSAHLMNICAFTRISLQMHLLYVMLCSLYTINYCTVTLLLP